MKIGVVGAGPAGACLAFSLAKAGADVTVLDGSHPREKPCGAMISKSLADFSPAFLGFSDFRPVSFDHYYTTPAGKTFMLAARDLPRDRLAVSRRVMDGFLLERALGAGASFVPEKVVEVARRKNAWELAVRSGAVHRFDFLAGADGALSVVRRATLGPFEREDLVLGMGCRFKNTGISHFHTIMVSKSEIRFLIPGFGMTQLITGRRPGPLSAKREKLGDFARRLHPKKAGREFFAAFQPMARDRSFFDAPRQGPGFLLLGDAAGFSNKLNGEGLPYAVRSANEAAAAIIEGRPGDYESRWRDTFGRELVAAASRLTAGPPLFLLELAALVFSKSPSAGAFARRLALAAGGGRADARGLLALALKTPAELLSGAKTGPPAWP